MSRNTCYSIYSFQLYFWVLCTFVNNIGSYSKSVTQQRSTIFFKVFIRWNTAAITTKTLETLKSWLKPIKSLSPKAISQVLRAERQQARQNDASDLTMMVRVKRFWNRQEHRFHRQTVCVPLPLTESEIKALKPW